LSVVPLPGPSAHIAALSASGLPSDGFLFLGFLPPKTSARKKFLNEFADFEYTLVLYESCHRITKFMNDLIEVLGPDRTICVARELTKIHETFYIGLANDVHEKMLKTTLKGEFVVVIAKKGFQL
jgi:16S rRNA (cytidine1402-2'-O)-methyltransferase